MQLSLEILIKNNLSNIIKIITNSKIKINLIKYQLNYHKN